MMRGGSAILLLLTCLQKSHASPLFPTSILNLRGGNEAATLSKADETTPVSVLVSTSMGSSFLDKKKRVQISRNSTIADLKELIESKFPASPPKQLQKLFLGMRYLSDLEQLGNITSGNSIQILLDMPSGTSVYNKSLSISQALEAYSALTVQQAYLGDQLKRLHSNSNAEMSVIDTMPESIAYRSLFLSLNETLYRTYAEDIHAALEIEKEPDVITQDTLAWRGGLKRRSPLVAAFAKEFDINLRSFRSFLYFSFLLAVRTF